MAWSFLVRGWKISIRLYGIWIEKPAGRFQSISLDNPSDGHMSSTMYVLPYRQFPRPSPN
eukprot:832561-Amorphochlora_amoeboformis.AAC.1